VKQCKLPPGIDRCQERLLQAGYAAYPVGGCVRDFLLGRVPGDYDITTSALPEQVLALFPDAIPTGLHHGTVTVPTPDGAVEVTTFRRDGDYADGRRPSTVAFGVELEEDLARRDFTINAMALARDGSVIDPFGGREDLARRHIRCVGDPAERFAEDALRMLRAIRFCAQLDFSLEEGTAQAIRAMADRTAFLSGERIYAEMEKLLCSPRPEKISDMLSAGLLRHLFPACPAPLPPLRFLRELPPTPQARWAGFCRATGFPISALPARRSVTQAVLHPERAAVRQLALTASTLQALGLEGSAIGRAQRLMALHILRCPQDNAQEPLLALLREQGVL